MDKEINKEYQPLIAYLTEIMQKLQNQSDVLRGKDIKICLCDEKNYTNNARVHTQSGTVIIGKQYLKKLAAKGEDFVAHTIAHELSHIVYGYKRRLDGEINKEEEIFADNYAHILCHRAGYNINLQFKKDTLRDEQNTDEHPADKIRQLIMNKTAAYLADENSPCTVKPFRAAIPDTPLTEVYKELFKSNTLDTGKTHTLHTDIQALWDNDLLQRPNQPEQPAELTEDQLKLQKVLQSESFTNEIENIYKIDFHKINGNDFITLYKQLQDNPEMLEDDVLQLKIRNHLAERSNIELNTRKDHQYFLKNIDDEAFETLKYMCFNKNVDDFRKRYIIANPQHQPSSGISDQALLADYLVAERRFKNPHYRQQIYDLFAKALLRDIGPDRTSKVFSTCLTKALEKLDGKIHNADVIPLVKTLRDTLGIEGQNLIILQKFAKDNNIEINQIRAEMLITKCLLDSDLAQKTVSYLMSDGKHQFGPHDNKVILRDIYKDWKNIDPSKRADYFALLMENVAPNATPAQKLEQFIDKRDDAKRGQNYNDSTYKPLVEMYLSTYKPEQQPYVVATLLSRKQPGARYGYEDYFKEILNSSGIKGLRALNQIYNTKLPEEILKIETNMSPLKAQDGIIFDNLRKLGVLAQKNDNTEIRKIGRHLMIATASKTPQFRTRNI